MRNDGLQLMKVVKKFDVDKKGYLSYDDFKKVIKLLGVKLSPSQVNLNSVLKCGIVRVKSKTML